MVAFQINRNGSVVESLVYDVVKLYVAAQKKVDQRKIKLFIIEMPGSALSVCPFVTLLA